MMVKPLFLITFILIGTVQAYTGCTNITSVLPSLVIWTYSSFLEYPSHLDFKGSFESAFNVEKGSVQVCRTSSSQLVDAVKSAPSGWPSPNVIIGLDNIIATQVEQSTFINFTHPRLAEFDATAMTLGHFQHMKPYDWGLIALLYNETILPQISAMDDAKTFNLESLLTTGIINQLVAIHPEKDTTGLGFLMWTVAQFGDDRFPQIKRIATNWTGGWREWWRQAYKKGLVIANSWSDAYDQFASTSTSVNLMTSYGSSPAYDYCTNGDANTRSVTSWYNGVQYGWAQVEGYVLLKNSSVAWNFIDYFMSPAIQNEIDLHQYMTPVNTKATLDACYMNATLAPTQVELLNKQINIALISDILPQLMTDWKADFLVNYINTPTSQVPTNSVHSTFVVPCTVVMGALVAIIVM